MSLSVFRPGLIILLCGLLLSACGFRLAGTADVSGNEQLPPQLASIYLVTRNLNAVQRRALEDSLTSAGAQLVAQADGSSVKLSVTLNELADTRLATGGSGGNVVKRINRSIDFNVKAADGEVILEKTSLRRQVDLTLDDDSLLASNRERRDVTLELEKELYDQLVRQLLLI